jgi:hypothetical protein
MRRAGRTILPLALLLAGVGCGSASQNSTVPTAVSTALVHAAFVDRADRICTQGRKRLILTGNRYFGNLPPNKDPSTAAVGAYSRQQAVPILKHQYARLRMLNPPPGDSATIDRILNLAEQGIRQLEMDPTLLNRGNGIPPGLQRARLGAYRYGLGACGQQIEVPTHRVQLGG